MPIPCKSADSILVNTVTPISSGRSLPYGSRISRDAAIIRSPPLACTFTIQTPSSAAAFTAFEQVFGIS
ncbi:Uncharacterised protein [Vibrio cholerae]|nr:Uncharacterised protein [Vibrio cholerae]